MPDRSPEVRALAPLQAPLCPLCGAANACAVARAGSFDVKCWCTSATFAPAALAAVPAEAVGKACLCPRCARHDAVDADAGANAQR